MASSDIPPPRHLPSQLDRVLARKDLLAGLMFMAVAVLGLWVSRDYPIGSALRMSTGYVPRLLCWVLLLLGTILILFGLNERPVLSGPAEERESPWRPLVCVVGSLIAFGLTIERTGLVVATLLLVAIGSLGSRSLRLFETLVAGVVLAAVCVGIFILGLGLSIPIWPDR
jgi:hypothetical protein